MLVINANRTVAHEIGTDRVCVHHPPALMGSPNGDTPLADGNLLVSEINGLGQRVHPGRKAARTSSFRSATRPIRSSSARTGT